jgi:uncharacterized membrane protein YcaP (DUF421 family)
MPTLFAGWAMLGRTLIVSILGYLSLLALLRLSGKRTLSKMNVFDFIVVVALGSVLAAVITNPQTSVADGIVAFAALMGLQTLLSVATRRSKRLERLINGQPALLVYRGRILSEALRRERVSEEELRAALRAAGAGRLEDVDAVVLETDGQFSTLLELPAIDTRQTVLSDVEGVPPATGPVAARSPDPTLPLRTPAERRQPERRRRERRWRAVAEP